MLGGQTMLLHAKWMLPEYISTILWPFALKCCEDCLNNFVHHADNQTPYETLAGLESSKIIMSNFHTFGCPCYVLDQRLQSGNGAVPKWKPCAQIGIYVGCSPSHASNVALIFNPRTGNVSSQIRIIFNDELLECNIFALAWSHHIGQTLCIPLPRFRCIMKSRWEPGNQFWTWK